MLLSRLEYGAFLTYTPRPTNEEQQRSKSYMYALKRDEPLDPTRTAAQFFVESLAAHLSRLPFAEFFGRETSLVPVPKSSRVRAGTLWVPKNLVVAMSKLDLGQDFDCLERVEPLIKAATSAADARPKPADHLRSLRVVPSLVQPSDILLVDDVITSGATALGAASRLQATFPSARIRAFAMIRTISDPTEFRRLDDPRREWIVLRQDGRAWRK